MFIVFSKIKNNENNVFDLQNAAILISIFRLCTQEYNIFLSALCISSIHATKQAIINAVQSDNSI